MGSHYRFAADCETLMPSPDPRPDSRPDPQPDLRPDE